jgi:cold shock CspA family protein
MAKSQQTFNKKEREKKRLQNRQDKEQKKADRKADGGKGKSLEDMMAYVDDNGNISSTPPDPGKKRTVQQDSIQISISKQAPMDPALAIRTGTVTFFNESKGYGFIRDHQTQESLFVHVTGLAQPVKEKDKVTFEVGSGPKGPSAVNVKLAK